MDDSKTRYNKLLILSVLVFFVYIFFQMPSALSWGPGPNYRNFSVRTTVNVTEAYPEVLNITCNNGSSILLTAGASTFVLCTVVIRDYNGGDTIIGINGSGVFNATFYYFQNKSSDPDEDNVHYSNASCSFNQSNGYYVNWTCGFDVQYFANNGTWRINVSVLDTHNEQNLSVVSSFNTTISPLYALNVTEVIDYGSLYTGQTSASSVEANVTNLGNMQINVTVYGFGGDNATKGVGLAMLCEQRNLSVSNERFSVDSGAPFASMVPLSGSPQMIPDLTLLKQTIPGNLITNSTYWAIHINISDNPFGVCNGTVVFSAVSS